MRRIIRYRACTFIVAAFLLGSCKQAVEEEHHAVMVKSRPVLCIASNGDRFLWLVAGETGEIFRTTDGGSSWQQTPAPPEERFWQVSFIDPLNGWAVTDHAAVWQTSDGGASWANIARLSYEDGLSEHIQLFPEHIQFIDKDNGWVVDPFWVWRTEDGGHNWSQSQPDLSDEGWTIQLFQTYFVNAETGLATGTRGAFYASSDGGRSWTRKPRVCDNDISGALFLDRVVGWIACRTSGIFGTENGGDDWFEAHLPDADITTPDEYILVGSLSFTSRREGWGAGAVEKYDAYSNFQSRGILLHTGDGGRNWVEVPVAAEERFYDSVRFADSSVGWLFGSSGKVYRTIDGGKSWTPVLTLPVD